MLLVMSTSGVLNNPTDSIPIALDKTAHNEENKPQINIWDITWSKIDKFLPNLREELFPAKSPPATTQPLQIASDTLLPPDFELVEHNTPNNLQPANEGAQPIEHLDGISNPNTNVSDDVIIV